MTERDSYGRLLPGHTNSPGRPKGVRNRIGLAFLEALERHWKQHGEEAINKFYRKYPHMYVKLFAYLVPKQLEVSQNPGDGIPHDELVGLLDYLRALARHYGGAGADGGQAIDRNETIVLPPLPKTG